LVFPAPVTGADESSQQLCFSCFPFASSFSPPTDQFTFSGEGGQGFENFYGLFTILHGSRSAVAAGWRLTADG
jgi:hypothetical protein